jgi:DNA primase
MLEKVKEAYSLLQEMEHDLGPGRRSGRWVKFPCPFSGHAQGDKDPSLAVTPDNGRFHCFGCGRSGDVITWFNEYREMSWEEIYNLADGDLPPAGPKSMPVKRKPPSGPPNEIWQARAGRFIDTSQEMLWSSAGRRALEYLRDRGFQDATIRRFQLGYCPGLPREDYAIWGIPENLENKGVWLPKGIVIPCCIGDKIWYINIRRPRGQPKYYKIRGSRSALFGAASLRGAEIVLLTEGEIDCMIVSQEIGDVCGVATLGGNSTKLDLNTWGAYLLPARAILAAYDSDLKSERGLANLEKLSPVIQKIRVPVLRPGDKDLNDYYLAGGDLWLWLRYNLHQLGILKLLGISFTPAPA